MAKISHTKIKRPSFGEKKAKVNLHQNFSIYSIPFISLTTGHSTQSIKSNKGQNNRVRVMVFNVTFNNISVISWWSVFLVEDWNWSTQRRLPQVTDKLYHIMLYQDEYTSPWAGFKLTTLVVMGTDCTGICFYIHL